MGDPRHPKRAFLELAGALHPHPERVRAELFRRTRFFDPLDKVQVKYEMLRAHAVDGESVAAVSDSFGFSRQTFYTVLETFEAWGLLGLSDEQRGRRGPLKLSADDVGLVESLARDDPALSGRAIAEHLFAERGVVVHRRTIERLVARAGKKNR
ncbi:MAG: helix-turn-helix domain-containing protein [Gemmatimonadota bacterium]|nr:helix-turn-helix domain-containing protein [Gemmatimonadota bacterium]